MNTIREKLAVLMPTHRALPFGWRAPLLALAFALAACAANAQPANDNFANATPLTGTSGSVTGDNSLATLEPCEPTALDTEYTGDPQTNSVWYVWNCPSNGIVTIDTSGTAFAAILSVWKDANPTPTLCDPPTMLAADDGQGQYSFSEVTFVGQAGTQYYISLASWDDGSSPFLNAGAFTVTWNETVPPVPTGEFQFTAQTYVVSQSDMASPVNADNNTVTGVKGARITVTRPAPAYGYVQVDYAVSNLSYVDVLITNTFGTNILITYIDTNNVVSYTNYYYKNLVTLSAYQFYNSSYQYLIVTNAYTNSTVQILGGVQASINSSTPATIIPDTNSLPMLGSVKYTIPGPGAGTTSGTTFGTLASGHTVRGTNFLNGAIATNNSIVFTNYAVIFTNTPVTNVFGTNISIVFAPTSPGGPYFSTNFYYTNTIIGLIYSTNSFYTNGSSAYQVLRTGTNWRANLAADVGTLTTISLNASNYQYNASSLGAVTPVPSMVPPGSSSESSGPVADTDGNITITVTNVYSTLTASYLTNNSAEPYGLPLTTGVLTFSNLQMSADIILPVAKAKKGIPTDRPALGQLILSNPQLDPQESPYTLQAPTVSATSGTALVNALSVTVPNPATAYMTSGVFNFERSTFRVSKNVDGTNAIISVNRTGGNPSDTVSVDYNIDPDYPDYSAIVPANDHDADAIMNIFDPANTFPLQAGSDFATPNSDFIPVSGTLSWGAYDTAPKQIVIPILNNGLVEFNQDLMIQLHNALPLPAVGAPGMTLGEVNQATLTITFEDDRTVLGGLFPGQQPAGAVDRSWNQDYVRSTTPPFVLYPGTTPGPGGSVYALAELPDGRALIAGSFVSYDGVLYNRIVRVLPTGEYDSSFQGLFSPYFNSGANDAIAAMKVQPDGQIVIGGNFTAYNGNDRHYIARLNPDGSIDPSFKPGLGANGPVSALALQSDGKILIAGAFTSCGGALENQVARLNADGTIDTSFASGVLGGTNVVVDAIAVDSQNRVLIGGNFTTVAGVNSGAIARLNADGSLDTTFAPGIGTFNPDTHVTDNVAAIAVQPDGQILMGGAFAYYNLTSKNGLVRLNQDGTLDLSFHCGVGTLNPVTGNPDSVNAILLQPDDNKILIGGTFISYNQTRRYGLARIFADGSLDTSFMDATYNQYAGVPSQYFNGNVVSPTYPHFNTRNAVNALAVESNPETTSSNILIGGTFEMVGGGYSRNDQRARSNVARVIGGQTPGPGNIEMTENFYSVNNSDGSKYVSLIRTNGNLGSIYAQFTLETAAPGPGVAQPGVDFNPVVQFPFYEIGYNLYTPEFWTLLVGEWGPNYDSIPRPPARPTGADVVVNVANPGNISGNLSANCVLSNPKGALQLGGEFIPNDAALGANMTAPFTIIDSNVKAGVLGFSSPTYSAIQGATVGITVTRTNGAQNQVTVWYATGDGTATNGVDYYGATNQITLAIGQTNYTIQVPTISRHTSVQTDKTIKLRLFTPGNNATLGQTNAVLTIVNTVYTPGVIAFSQPSYSVNETAGNAIVTVNRLGGSSGSIDVTFKTVDGTASAPVNYIGTNVTLHWDDKITTSRTIVIPVKDDGVVTPDLTVGLILTNSMVNGTNSPGPLSYGSATSPTNSTLTIVNVDSAGAFGFSQPAYSVKKYAGYALVPVMRLGGSIGTTTVSFTTADGTATNGVDYVLSTNTLTFTNGQVSALVRIPLLDSGVPNTPSGPRALSLKLLNPTGSATLGANNPSTLYIIDSEVVNETPGSQDNTYSPFAGFNNTIHALALQPNNQLLAVGDFTMANGVTRNRVARLNSDGSLDSGFSLPSNTYGADNSVQAVSIQKDGRILVGGFFTNINSVARGHIARLNADGALDSIFNPGSGADNPVYAVAETFIGGDSKVLVAGSFASFSGTGFHGIGRLNTDGTPDYTFNPSGAGANNTVYALAVQPDGKVLIGGDFTTYNGAANLAHIARLNADGSTDTNFNAAGIGANDSVRAIAIQLDGKIVIGGLFTNVNGVVCGHVARLNPNGSVDTSFKALPGANDAVLTIGIQSDTRIVLGGQFTTYNGVTRNYVTRLNPDGSIDPSINFGLGANGPVNALAVQQDAIYGYPSAVPDEKIIAGGGFTEYDGAASPHLARIFGGSIGGSGAFQFSSAGYQVDETGVSALITVLRTGGTTNSATGDITVRAFTSEGTAKANRNYVAISTNIDFPLGEVARSFSVPVMDDGVITPNLTVNLTITNPAAPATIGNQPTAILTIINDDSSLSLSSSLYSVPKNIVSHVAPVTVVRNGGTNTTATVYFTTTTNGTALIGTDYTPTNQLLVFNPGISERTVNIPINDNGLAEGNRTVTMILSNIVGSVLAQPTNATLTILDTVTLPGQLFFTSSNFVATSDQGVVNLTVLRTNGLAGSVAVNYVLVPSGVNPARSNVDYDVSNGRGAGSITFPAGIGTNFVPVYLLNGAGAQGPVTLSAQLYNPTNGATLIEPTNTTLTILNNNAVFFFTQATNYVPEDAGVANIVVQRSSNSNVVASVNYATASGTAIDGSNYLGSAGTLTFGVGESFKAIAIPLLNRSNIVDETFKVSLSNPVNGFVVAPSNTLVVLQGAAAGVSFATNATTVSKGAGYIPVTVICSNPRVEPVLGGTLPLLRVTYTTVDGSARAGINYNATSGTLFFTNGVGTNTFNVAILNPAVVSSNLTFSLLLTNVSYPGRIAPYGAEVVTITESRAALHFSQPGYSVYKNAGLATITVVRDGFTNSTVSIDYSVTNGTAINGQNFYATNGTLTFTNGGTRQSFNVPIIANSQVQPNLFALMQLSNPSTNAEIVQPGAATLGILENGGSYVVPAGALLVSSSSSTNLHNDVIGSNDTVQVQFAFRDAAGLNVTNLIATLVATNGVTAPSGSQTYGPLKVYGHSVSRPFTFTARGTNALTIAPTFQLYDNTKYIGPATFVFTIGTWTTTFANTNAIVINDNAAATPYPAGIVVTNLGHILVKATVTLTNVSHQEFSDIDALMVSPTTNTLLMGHVGSPGPVKHVTLTFDSDSTNSLPSNGSIVSGTNKPTQYGTIPNFP